MKLRNKKTGEIGYLIVGRGFDHYVVANDNWESCGEYDSLAELNEEWQDCEEPKEHFFITEYGDVYSLNEYEGLNNVANVDDYKQIGNYFETEEEAKKVVEKLKAWKRLKDRGFEFCGYDALGCGEIHFTSDWDIEDEYEKGQRRKDLDLLFGGGE